MNLENSNQDVIGRGVIHHAHANDGVTNQGVINHAPTNQSMLQVAAGVHLNVQHWGQGAPVVMCHGLLFGSMAAWYFSTALPLSQQHQVALYDTRGHGKSDWAVQGYDLNTQCEDLAKVIRHTLGTNDENHAPVTLIGHSYGAMTALAYALEYPHRLSRLILVDAPHPLSQYVRPGLDAVRNKDELLQRYHTQIGAGGRRAERLRQRLEFLLFASSLRKDIESCTDFSQESLAALDIPVLCIYGEHSECRDSGIELTSILPKATLAWVNCGHYVTDDAPAEMLALIQSFIGH